ncbi:hypothetical protein HII31_08081 [Pseudocercospora fuligena]|uniref:F-box domain-containing protein n=1 Tax=Pseudocercospora fuligena TaxID=685502 RepID=A0A8H6RHK3_9PEZI|nr:hypothetical protein HII31_08081 [Pseudocercospora fuligena]
MSKRKAVSAADLPPSRRSKRLQEKMGDIDEVQAQQEDESPYPRASLLGLPAELLNRIYREVLVENFKIPILEMNKPQYPGLITVCRKTYQESRLIYLEENTFEIYCFDYKVPMPLNTSKHWILHSKATRFVVYQGSLNWTNLMTWVKLWYEDKALRAPEPILQGGRLMPRLAARVFSIAEAMGQVDWDTMERVLEEVKMGFEDVGVAFGY